MFMIYIQQLVTGHNMSKKCVLFIISLIVVIDYKILAQVPSIAIQTYDSYLEMDKNIPKYTQFPDNFKYGAAGAAYQIEGAWNIDGKGVSIWDTFVHRPNSTVVDHETGDVACDSYHKYPKDVQLLTKIGFQYYRLSLSWPRILPNGNASYINPAGVAYYNNLINLLIKNNIVPVVTLYQWDLPQTLQNIGGWPNPILADYFVDYSRVVFKLFGDRVKLWTTINEAWSVCYGYGNKAAAPGVGIVGVTPYLVGHTLLRAHGKTYRMYNKEFRSTQNGKIGMPLFAQFGFSQTSSLQDRQAGERFMQFQIGWFAHPIYSTTGDYPPIMRQRIDANSAKEGRKKSRLPYFTPQEIAEIKGSADFIGLNHYFSQEFTNGETGPNPSWIRDGGFIGRYDPRWPATFSPIYKVTPQGMRGLLRWVKEEYNNPLVLITENGYAGPKNGGLNDQARINFHDTYLTEMLRAIYYDKCRVFGYIVWSLMDNFEWSLGYSVTFGVNQVNFNDPARTRTSRMSASYFKMMIKTNKLPNPNQTFPLLKNS